MLTAELPTMSDKILLARQLLVLAVETRGVEMYEEIFG